MKSKIRGLFAWIDNKVQLTEGESWLITSGSLFPNVSFSPFQSNIDHMQYISYHTHMYTLFSLLHLISNVACITNY